MTIVPWRCFDSCRHVITMSREAHCWCEVKTEDCTSKTDDCTSWRTYSFGSSMYNFPFPPSISFQPSAFTLESIYSAIQHDQLVLWRRLLLLFLHQTELTS